MSNRFAAKPNPSAAARARKSAAPIAPSEPSIASVMPKRDPPKDPPVAALARASIWFLAVCLSSSRTDAS